MKKYYNIRLLMLVCLVFSFGFLTSCDDNDDTMLNNGQVALLSFGPTGAKHGEKIQFIGYNLDKVESIELPGATVAKAQFTSQSSELIELTIPAAATAGKVILKVNGSEDIISKTNLSFEVPVTITSVTAEARPGANVAVTGNFLNWVDSVKFGDDEMYIKEFVTKSMNELVFTVPMAAKTGVITFYTGGTEPLAIETENVVVVTLPKVTEITPVSLKHGENLTLTGTDLDLVSMVKFKGVGTANVSSFVSQTPTQLVVTVPDNASAGTLTLVAANSLVEAPTTQSVTIILPAITGLSPNAIEPLANLTINGTNLDLVKSITFTGGASVSNFVSRSATQLVVAVPADALSGTLTLITQRNYSVATQQTLTVILDRPPYFIYNEALNAEWQKWGGWGTTLQDMETTEQKYRGAKAIKLAYNDNYGALQLHPNKADVLTGYTTVRFYVYGAESNTGTNRMALQIKGAPNEPTFMVEKGKWQLVEIAISSFGALPAAGIQEFYFKNYGTQLTNTVYIDDIELR